jgi:hypothetical protein
MANYSWAKSGTTSAIIEPASRISPADSGQKVELVVDEHTNTVLVKPTVPVTGLAEYDPNDEKRDQLHYEYALVYWDEDGNMVLTDYQDSPYFGGELVSVDTQELESDGTAKERPEGTGGGQTVDAADTGFGTRDPLPRGTYVGALVRLARTNNYEESTGVASFRDYDTGVPKVADTLAEDQMTTPALESALQAAFDRAVDEVKAETEKLAQQTPEAKERITERLSDGPVVKTYTYSIQLVSTSEEKDAEGESYLRPILEEVWFTDLEELEKQEDLDRLVENLDPVRYYKYSWDEEETVSLEFPLSRTDELLVELPTEAEDGTTQKVETNMNDETKTWRFYVSVYRSGGSYLVDPESITVTPEELVLQMGDDPVQLEVIFTPQWVTNSYVTWNSSDTSVVTVSRHGLVTVVGPGTAEITVTTWNGKTAVVPVQVLPQEKMTLLYMDTMFDAGYDGAFLDLIDGRFEPDRVLTRGELAIVMAHFFQTVEDREPATAHTYIDVSPDSDCAQAVELLDRWGIVVGVGEDRFAPDRAVTRAEMSAILSRMLLLSLGTDPEIPHAFADAGPEDTWAWAYVDALAGAGITKGTGGGNYSPDALVTRAEVATFIARILATEVNMDAEGLIIPTDVTPAHWAYLFILRAVNSGAMLMIPDKYYIVPSK